MVPPNYIKRHKPYFKPSISPWILHLDQPFCFFRPGVATGAETKARQTLRVACRSFPERETMGFCTFLVCLP